MSLILPSFNYSLLNLGKLRIKGVKQNELGKPVIEMELERDKTLRLGDLFSNDRDFATNKVVPYFPVSPDGSYAVRVSENVINALNFQDGDPYTIPVLFINMIRHDKPTAFENQLIMISATKKLDSIFASTFNFDDTKPRAWLLFYFNKDTLVRILKSLTNQEDIDLEMYNYAELKFGDETYNIRFDYYLAGDTQFYPKSFMKVLSEEDKRDIYNYSKGSFELKVTTSRLSIDEIHVGGTLYIKPRTGKIPYQYPFVIPFTYTNRSVSYPDDVYLNTFSLNVIVKLKIEKLDDFIKGFLDYIKRSDHLLQSLQKVAISKIFIEGIKECRVADYENIIRVERNTHFLLEKSKFTSVIFGYLIRAIERFIEKNNEISKILENPDINLLVEKLVETVVDGKINYENLRSSRCREEMKLRLATAILEVSLHGIAHLLKKGLVSKLSVSPSDLGEYITIKTPYTALKNIQILDGFYFYDTLASNSNEIQGEVKVFVKRSYSYDSYKFDSKDFTEVLDMIRNIIYVKDQQYRCDYNWEHEKLQLSRVFHIMKSDTSQVSGVRMSDCVTILDEYVKREIGGKAFYPPRSMFRYLYLKKPKLKKEIENCGAKMDERKIERLYMELKRPLQYIWPRYVHQCFDGCYSCVMLQRRECDLIDIQQEYRISKAGALYLLDL